MSDTGISVAQLFQLLETKHRDVILLSSFQKELSEEMVRIHGAVSEWQNAILDERGAAEFIQFAIRLLEQMAIRSAGSPNHEVYGEATRLAQTVQTILADRYGFRHSTITIMSPTERLATLRN